MKIKELQNNECFFIDDQLFALISPPTLCVKFNKKMQITETLRVNENLEVNVSPTHCLLFTLECRLR